MKIQTLSIVVGGNACNASCPYCVSKMTGKVECSDRVADINWRNFHKTCELAKNSGVNTILLTGKGEPLLYPAHIHTYLEELKRYNFPFIELQTNGIELLNLNPHALEEWYIDGLTTVSLSCAHWDDNKNRTIFGKHYRSLQEYIKILHRNKFFVRVSCVMLSDKINDAARVKHFAKKCKEWGVEQFTVRSVSNSVDEEEVRNDDDIDKIRVYYWVENHQISFGKMNEIENFLDKDATLLLELAHGAKVYDYEGQNISLSNCLTSSTNLEDIRQLIFYSDGRLMHSWTKKGAILL